MKNGKQLVESLVVTFGALAFIFTLFIFPVMIADDKYVDIIEAGIKTVENIIEKKELEEEKEYFLDGEIFESGWKEIDSLEISRQIDTKI